MRWFGKIVICLFAVLGLFTVGALAYKGLDNQKEPTEEIVETPAGDETNNEEAGTDVEAGEEAGTDVEAE